MSKRQRLRKEKRENERKQQLRELRAQRNLYRVAFPWRKLTGPALSLLVVVLLVWLVPKGILWWASRAVVTGPFGSIAREELEANRFATLVTTAGEIQLELLIATAPLASANFVLLAQDDAYDEVKFHRVIPDFMVQTGDPNSKDDSPEDDGTGGPGYLFDDEFNSNTPALVRGMVAMANPGQPDSNGSQFFIITADETPWLDGAHTPFARVVSGMEVVDAISQTATDDTDRPLTDISITDVILGNQ